MVKSTLEDMVLFMYEGLNGNKKMQMKKEMDESWALKEKFNVMKESYDRLNRMKLLSPRQQTIDAIMKYAAWKSVAVSR